jgi:hypothetical protein
VTSESTLALHGFREDLGFIPSFADWVKAIRPEPRRSVGRGMFLVIPRLVEVRPVEFAGRMRKFYAFFSIRMKVQNCFRGDYRLGLLSLLGSLETLPLHGGPLYCGNVGHASKSR